MPLLVQPSDPPEGSLTNYAANALLDHLFSKSTFTQPDIYVGLGTTSGEISGMGYARVATTSSDWSSGSDSGSIGIVSNLNTITFANPTGNWGLVSKIHIWDSLSGGNQLAEEDLEGLKDVVAGQEGIEFGVGDISIAVSGAFEDEILGEIADFLFGNRADLRQYDICWLALADNYGDEPTDSGTGYDREPLAPANWNNASNKRISNSANVVMEQPLANWGTIYVCELWTDSLYGDSSDTNSGGGFLIARAWFDQTRDVTAVDAPPEFLAGLLRVWLT